MILKSWVLGHQVLPDSHTHPTNMDSGVSQVYLSKALSKSRTNVDEAHICLTSAQVSGLCLVRFLWIRPWYQPHGKHHGTVPSIGAPHERPEICCKPQARTEFFLHSSGLLS